MKNILYWIYLMEHTESATNLLWWFLSVTFNLALSPFTLCARPPHHLVMFVLLLILFTILLNLL